MQLNGTSTSYRNDGQGEAHLVLHPLRTRRATMQTLTIDPGAAKGGQAKLVLVDESPTGHLDVDDVWLEP